MRVKDDKKEKAIFDAAISLITANGLADTSMSKIAKAADVSDGAGHAGTINDFVISKPAPAHQSVPYLSCHFAGTAPKLDRSWGAEKPD